MVRLVNQTVTVVTVWLADTGPAKNAARDMRDLSNDSRFLLLTLVGDLSEAGGSALARLFHEMSPEGQVERHLNYLVRAGWLHRAGEGRIDRRIFSLTDSGRARALGGDDPEKLWARSWSGKWTLVAFDVPESKQDLRARLRRKLRRLRFGWLQNSVWISPDAAGVVTRDLGVAGIAPDSLSIFEASPAGGESAADIVTSAWDFAQLERDYTSFRKVLDHRPSGGRFEASRWRKWIEQELQAWRRICVSDPFLPEVLLPAGYPGQKAWRQRVQIYGEIGRALAESMST